MFKLSFSLVTSSFISIFISFRLDSDGTDRTDNDDTDNDEAVKNR